MSVFNDITILSNLYAVTTQKGDVMINDGVKNNRLPVGTDKFVITADSTQPYGLRWADPRFNDIIGTQLSLTTLPISTNSPDPIEILEFTSTPSIGKYTLTYNLTYSMSNVTSRTTVFGIYINDVLVANSARNINSAYPGIYNTFTSQAIVVLGGSDILKIKYNVSVYDTTTDIISGNMILLKFSTSNV